MQVNWDNTEEWNKEQKINLKNKILSKGSIKLDTRQWNWRSQSWNLRTSVCGKLGGRRDRWAGKND